MALNRHYNRDIFPAGFGELFHPAPFLVPRFPSLELFNNADFIDFPAARSGYHMTEDNGKYHISVDLPGVKASEVNVELQNDGTVLHISGGRKITTDNTEKEYKFDKRFTVSDNVDTEHMTANLADGVLTLTAPKKEEIPPKTRTIAITENPGSVEPIDVDKTHKTK